MQHARLIAMPNRNLTHRREAAGIIAWIGRTTANAGTCMWTNPTIHTPSRRRPMRRRQRPTPSRLPPSRSRRRGSTVPNRSAIKNSNKTRRNVKTRETRLPSARARPSSSSICSSRSACAQPAMSSFRRRSKTGAELTIPGPVFRQEHDLFRKPVSTLRDRAPATLDYRFDALRCSFRACKALSFQALARQ